MKKIILFTLTALMMAGCGLRQEDNERLSNKHYQVIVIDSCEYYALDNGLFGDMTHKGNCRFCKERRQKELVEQLKKLLCR